MRRDPNQYCSVADILTMGLPGLRSHSVLHRWIRIGAMPSPIVLPSRQLTWRGQTILDWLDGLETTADLRHRDGADWHQDDASDGGLGV